MSLKGALEPALYTPEQPPFTQLARNSFHWEEKLISELSALLYNSGLHPDHKKKRNWRSAWEQELISLNFLKTNMV